MEPVTWLEGELRAWVSDRVISESQAETIRGRYRGGRRIPWGMIVFSSLGAVIAGLGVILLFAYNWRAIPKFGKLALVFGVLLAAHGAGIRLFFSGGRWRGLGEGLCLLGSMMFGAGIWLVAQIYHIGEHFPNGFAIWGLGTLGMAWAMSSVPQGILAAVLLAVWSGVESVAFDTSVMSVPLVLLFGLGTLAYVKRSRLLVAVLIPAFVASTLFFLVNRDPHVWSILSLLLNLTVLFIGVSFWLGDGGVFPGAAPIFGVYGWGGYFLFLYLFSFPALSEEFFGREPLVFRGMALWVCWIAPFLAMASVWIAVLARRVRGGDRQSCSYGGEIYLAPLTVVLAYADMLFGGKTEEAWRLAGPFNLAFLAFAVVLMGRGCRQGRLRPTVWGSLLLILLAVTRYFDLFESLFIRGVVFVGVGAVVFAEGILYARAKKSRGEGGDA